MKRWSLFLFLFLAGLGVLWLIERGQRRDPRTPDPSATQVGPTGEGPLTQVPIDKDKTASLLAEGPFYDNKFDPKSGLTLYRITAVNTQSLGNGVYRFDKLVARFFVPGTEQLRVEIRAEKARGRLIFAAPSLTPTLDPDYPVELDDVVATLHEGSPFVPLTVRVPHAKGSIADQKATSTDRVDISGTGLSAGGVGLSIDGKAREVRLERNTHAELTLEDGTPATLTAVGGISFTSLEKLGEGASLVVAREKAHLTFAGPEPVVVDADTVELDALVTRTPSTKVKPTRVSAHGSVVLAPTDGKFFGDDAELILGADGKPEQATLIGFPRVELLLCAVDTASVPGGVGAKTADLDVRMTGAGPLEVELKGDPHFDFRGPATLMLPSLDMDLTAQDKLSGTRKGDSQFARLDATGKVEARWAGSTMTSDALSIERKLTADGQVAAGLESPGFTRAKGPLEDGGTFDLTARNGLEFVRLAKSFQVPIAREVDLAVTGPGSFVAKAQEVRDLDSLTRAFVGIGDVFFDSVKGRGRGERIISRSKDSAELVGTPSTPAHVDLEHGWVEARGVVFDVDKLRAEGDAHAIVGLEGNRYDVNSRWVSVTRKPAGEGETLVLEAGGDVTAHIDEDARKLDVSASTIEARASSPGKKLEKLKSEGLVATGNVAFHSSGEQELSGNGDRLVIEADRSGRLYPADAQRVHLWGELPKDDLTFDMTSGDVSFARASLSAENPVIEIQGVDVPLGKARASGDLPLRAVAGSMSVDETSILFTDGVYLGQSATGETAWSLDAEKLVLLGSRVKKPEANEPRFTVSTVMAWGGFQAVFAQQLSARGSTLLLDHDRNRLTLRGDPAELDNEGQRLSTDWLELELDTGFLRTSKGSWVPLSERNGPYEITFESMAPAYGIDSRVQVVREFSYLDPKGQRQTRASWALFWLDEARLQRMAAELMPGLDAGVLEVPESTRPPLASRNIFVKKFATSGFTTWVKEVYLEGNIEVIEKGERRVRAGSVYANMVDGHGWVRDIDVIMDMPMRSEAKRLKFHADWLRYAPDGSASAERAVVTSCEFEKPHYEVTLGDLSMKRRPSAKARKAIAAGRSEGADETDGYVIRSKHNSLRFGKGPNLPLGPFAFMMDNEFHIDPESVEFLGIPLVMIGQSGRYGLSIGLSFALPLGWLSKQIGRVLGDSSQSTNEEAPEVISQKTVATVKYFNKRGLLLGAENRVKQEGVFNLSTELDFIYDFGKDRGLVRVPKSERSSLRAWLHMDGRRLLGDREWIDINLTKQTDAGVQAEFFEGDFLRWEERETYLHWRKARGLDYSRATIEAQLDDHRTEVIDEPSLGYTRGRAGVTRWWHRDVVYSSDTTIGHLRRVEGDPRFEAPFPDGFGEQEALRLDTTHRWEMPMPLGVLDARVVPFLEARGTAWNHGVTGSEPPTRAALLVGAEASTTFWRMYGDGDVHSLTPTLGVRGDLDVEESGPIPAQFDGVEDPVDGNFADFGLRSRWIKPGDTHLPDDQERFLDIELRETYANDLSGGRDDGWLPLRLNAQWLTEAFAVPFGITHDARYDLDAKNAEYSRTLLAVRPFRSLEIQTGFHTGRDLAGGSLYSVWSLGARYEFSPKWQFQANESVSSSSGSELSSGFLLRRIGHDFIFELEYSFTAGEGGGSVSFSVIPMVGYRESRFNQLSNWQKQGD